MAIRLVENRGGRTRVRWSGAAALLAFLAVGCVAIPAAALWLLFDDATLATSAVGTGLALTAAAFGALLGQSLARPHEQLPPRVPGAPARR